MKEALGLLETTGFAPAMVALDAMDKTWGVAVVQVELNDFLGVCLKVTGSVEAVRLALDAGWRVAHEMGGRPVADCISRPDNNAWPAMLSPSQYNPLIQQNVVYFPSFDQIDDADRDEKTTMTEPTSLALGLIETQGFTAVFEAIDRACKAANVEVVGKEKLGGGYVTVIIRGDVAAVKAAVEAGRAHVGDLGKLIAAHVIARPSKSVLSLLPRLSVDS